MSTPSAAASAPSGQPLPLGPPPGRLAKHLDRSPGPAQFNFPSGFGSKKGPHLYSFTGKSRTKREYPTPDPAKYSMIEWKAAGYSFSMAGKLRMRDKEEVPGPGKYFDDKSKQNTSFGQGPAYSLSGRHRIINKTSELGPGSHNVDTAFTALRYNPPKYSLAAKFRMRDKTADEPGPGKYDPANSKSFGKGGPLISLSGRHRLKYEAETPGPATYSQRDWLQNNQSPKFTFGHSRRVIERHWSTVL